MANPGEQLDVAELFVEAAAVQAEIAERQARLAEIFEHLGAAMTGQTVDSQTPRSLPAPTPNQEVAPADSSVPLALRQPFSGLYSKAVAANKVPLEHERAAGDFDARIAVLLSPFAAGLHDDVRTEAKRREYEIMRSFWTYKTTLDWDATNHPVQYEYSAQWQGEKKRQPIVLDKLKIVQRPEGNSVFDGPTLTTKVEFSDETTISGLSVAWHASTREKKEPRFPDEFRNALGTRETIFIPDYEALIRTTDKGAPRVFSVARLSITFGERVQDRKVRIGHSLRHTSYKEPDDELGFAEYTYHDGGPEGPQFVCSNFRGPTERPAPVSLEAFERYVLFALSTIPRNDTGE